MVKYILFAGTHYQILPFFGRVSEKLSQRGIENYFVQVDVRERWLCRKYGLDVLPKKRKDIINKSGSDINFDPAEIESCIKDVASFLRLDKEAALFLAKRILVYFNEELERRRPDLIVIWNGTTFVDSLLAFIAKKKGLKLLFCENGYLPNTMQIDSQGANWYSSIKRLDLSNVNPVSSVSKTPEIVRAPSIMKIYSLPERLFFYFIRMGRLYEILDPFENFSIWQSNVPSYLKRYLYNLFIKEEKNVILPEKFVFLPFQVEKDSQLYAHSPYIKTMREFLSLSVPAIKSVIPEYAIVIKEHPEDFGKRKDYKKLRKKYHDIIWLKNYPVDKLIKKASLVVTINSTVGFEAIVENKPVVTLGRSFYNKEGIVSHAERPEDLEAKIREALAGCYDNELRRKFIAYLQGWFVETNVKNISENSINTFVAKIMEKQ